MHSHVLSLTLVSAHPHHTLMCLSCLLFLKMPARCPASERTEARSVKPACRKEAKVTVHEIMTACTLVLAVVHPVLGGVIVLSETSALGGIWLVRNVLIVLLLGRHLGGLLWFRAFSQRLEHGEVIVVLLWLCRAEETKKGGKEKWALKMNSSYITVAAAVFLLSTDEFCFTGSAATWFHSAGGNKVINWLAIRFPLTSWLYCSLHAVRLCDLRKFKK